MDPAAADSWVADHFRLLYGVALTVQPPYPYSHDDLVQEGAIAAKQALMRWDPSGGASALSFALSRAKGAMIDFCRSHSWGWTRNRGREAYAVSIEASTWNDLDGDETAGLAEFLAGRADDQSRPELDDLLALIRGLPEREQIVLLALANDWTQAEIGRLLGVSESRVSQIRTRAAARLRPRQRGKSLIA